MSAQMKVASHRGFFHVAELHAASGLRIAASRLFSRKSGEHGVLGQ
jgi:hypothetical protein